LSGKKGTDMDSFSAKEKEKLNDDWHKTIIVKGTDKFPYVPVPN